MSRLLRRLVPLAAVLAWRNRAQLSDWYRKRNEADADVADPGDTGKTQTQIAPIPSEGASHRPSTG